MKETAEQMELRLRQTLARSTRQGLRYRDVLAGMWVQGEKFPWHLMPQENFDQFVLAAERELGLATETVQRS